MNVRVTWILFLTALAMGGYLYVTGLKPAATAVATPGAYAPVVPAEVRSVELLRSNAVVRVERTPNGWAMVLPVRYGAQGTAVDTFLESLGKLRPRTYIPSSQIVESGTTNGLKAFGLGEGSLTLKLEMAAGPATLFRLGGPTPLGGQFYFQRVGADGIYTADDSFLSSIPRSADSWRDRSLFDLTGTPFDRIEVRGKSGFVAEKEPRTGAWRLVRPLTARADGGRIETLLGALARTRVAGFVADSVPVDLGPLGLQPAESELIVGRGTNDLVRVQFGRSPTNAPDFVFARRMANTNLVLVPVESAEVLRLPLSNFRDRNFLPDLAGADQIEFRMGSNHAVLDRRGTNWVIAGTPPHPADSGRVSQLLSQLVGIQIVEFSQDVPADLKRFGLDRSDREWVLRTGTNELVRFSLGATNGLDKIFARRADEMPVYSIPLAEAYRLPDSAPYLRSLRFDPTNVTQITVVRKGVTNLVTRNSERKWQSRTSVLGPLYDEALNETLYRMGHLDAARRPLLGTRQLDLLKFPETDYLVTLAMAPESPLEQLTLRFGGPTPLGNQYATAQSDGDAHGFLFEFPGALYLDVLRDLGVP
ncbi:MAG: DUF4340 domain-containing protein [Verrucomicrobiota bacterium]